MFKGFRTLIWSAALTVVGLLQTFDWATVIPVEWTGVALAVVGVVTAVLRVITDSPVGSSETKA